MVRTDLGIATAYAEAVSKGYTGTRDEFGQMFVDFGKTAEKVSEDKKAVEQMKTSVEETKNSVDTTAAEFGQNVADKTEEAKAAITEHANTEKASATAAISEAKDAATGVITEAQTSATDAIAAVKDSAAAEITKKGNDTLATIPEDYTTLSKDVDSLKKDLVVIKTKSNINFSPVWGCNIYISSDIELVKEQLNKAKELCMTEVLLCTNFQDDNERDFYHAYNYVASYGNIDAICDYAKSIGITVSAFKIHRDQALNYSTMDWKKYTKGITAMTGYVKSENKPDTIFCLNENELVISSKNDSKIVGVLNTIKNLGYKAGISFFGSYQYIQKCTLSVLKAMDIIGINYYEQISPKGVSTTINDGINAWHFSNVANHFSDVMNFSQKEVWMTESGTFDAVEALYFPADSYTWGLEKEDGTAESIYFTGLFEEMRDSSHVKIFGWDINQLYSDKMIELCNKYIGGSVK